jgi:VWFA-related protein
MLTNNQPTVDARRTGAATVCSILSILLALGSLDAATAQQEPPPTFTEQMEVTEVLLDVVVTDRNGNLVAGLGPADFVVEEDGREIKLTGADFYTTRYGAGTHSDSTAPSGPETLGAIPASRYIIFFFHDARTMANKLNRLIRQQLSAAHDSRRWVEEEMQPSDWVAITGYGMRLKIFQDFTQNREALLEAITAAAKGVNPDKDRWTRDPASSTAPSLLRHLPAGKDLSGHTRQIYSGMRLLAEATGHIVGRKTLLYFGIGFGDIDGFDGNAIADRRYYPHLEQALNDNNVAVYPIDLTIQGRRHAQSSFLNGLANDTGGFYYRNFASFLGPLTAITDANIGYYLLSYSSEHPSGESGYQRIRVRTTAPDLVVQAQRGYRYGSSRR